MLNVLFIFLIYLLIYNKKSTLELIKSNEMIFSYARLLPKSSGMRTIINMSRKMIKIVIRIYYKY